MRHDFSSLLELYFLSLPIKEIEEVLEMIESKNAGCAQSKIVKDGFPMIIINCRRRALAIMKHSTLRKSRYRS